MFCLKMILQPPNLASYKATGLDLYSGVVGKDNQVGKMGNKIKQKQIDNETTPLEGYKEK